jgi:hypothetical protein
MRRTLALTVAVLAIATTALAKHPPVNVPSLLKHQIATLHAKGIGPILLPETMSSTTPLYPTVDVAGSGYSLDLGSAKNCHGATACFVAEFSARHGRPSNHIKVALTHGISGYYRPSACGASCSAPSIEFRQSGFIYHISAVMGSESAAKRILTSMANSSITHGAR